MDSDNKGYDEALRRIRECAETESESLDLFDLKLEALPEEIGRVASHVTSFCCIYNELTSLDGIEKLENLTFLNCSFNPLKSLEGIEKLEKLTVLYCGANRLESLEGIEKLEELTSLDCSTNRLESLEGIVKLEKLTELNCSDNRLESLEGIQKLEKLTELDCSDNRLESLEGIEELEKLTGLDCSCNYLKSLEGIEKLIKLIGLDCGGNELESLDAIKSLTSLRRLDARFDPVRKIPHSLLNDIDGLRAYWRDVDTSGALYNTRAKLFLVGNGRVGKTTLAYALKTREPVEDNFESTEGIILDSLKHTDQHEKVWDLQVWDFAGQDLYQRVDRQTCNIRQNTANQLKYIVILQNLG